MREDKLSEAERRLFNSLEKELQPPGSLEAKIVSQLYGEGLIKNNKPKKRYMRIVMAVAAAILIFIGGIYADRESSISPVSINPERGYMLILYEDQNFRAGDPETMAKEYGQWMQNTLERGVKITGQELDQRATVVGNEGQVTRVEPCNEGKITGYFILEANSLRDALVVARDNPHTKYGGTIAVKSFMVR